MTKAWFVLCCLLFRYMALQRVIYRRKTKHPICGIFMKDATTTKQTVEHYIGNVNKAIGLGVSAIVYGSLAGKANAIGQLYELQNQSMVIQDVCFNINAISSIDQDCSALNALFVNNCRVFRNAEFIVGGNQQTKVVLGFGPEEYLVPKNFIPGISILKDYGGHATITLQSSSNSGIVGDRYVGNGLKYLKIGADTIRLSKAVEKGAIISYAYGWVDIATPSGIPLQVVVGECRDPLMLACIQVSNMAESVEFFTQTLGMKLQPFPFARQKGSAFEPTPPKDSVYVGYGADTMGLLLVPFVRSTLSPTLQVGNMLHGFTIVVDTTKLESLPPYVVEQFQTKSQVVTKMRSGSEAVCVSSPDGYRFTLKPYSVFATETATRGQES